MERLDTIKPGTPLTKREREVLILVGKGFTNAEIGRLLSRSPHTIGSHMKVITKRLDVNSRVEAAVWACRQGWL